MTLIRIPDHVVPGFKVLFGLSEKTRDQLIRHIIERPIGTSLETLIETIPSEIEGKREDAEMVVSMLEPLYGLRMETELSLEDFIPEFLRAIDRAKVSIPSEIDFEGLLRKLLSDDKNYVLTEKLSDLVREGERIFSKARIVTDIRPMVDESDDDCILGLTIVHQLRISFLENNQRKSLYFLLNRTDLEELEEVISRAQNKESSFKKKFASEATIFHEEK